VLHEERVQRDPVAGVDDRAQPLLGLLGRPGPHDAQSVRDPVHVGVDRYRGDPVAEDEDAIGGLRADAGEARELGQGPRDFATEPPEDLLRAGADGPGLRSVEPHRPDERLDRRRAGRRERPGVGEACEQRGGGDVGLLVPRALRQDRPHQDLERIGRVVAEVGDAPIARPIERRQPVEDALPVGRRERTGGQPALPAPARPGDDAAGREGGGPTPGSERSGSSLGPSPRRSSPIR
jgi:hypothetical protein